MLSARGANLLALKPAADLPAEVAASGIRSQECFILLSREIEITVDCATAKLKVQGFLFENRQPEAKALVPNTPGSQIGLQPFRQKLQGLSSR
jgi:hypothetical protein